MSGLLVKNVVGGDGGGGGEKVTLMRNFSFKIKKVLTSTHIFPIFFFKHKLLFRLLVVQL